jgi:hypothetical protein
LADLGIIQDTDNTYELLNNRQIWPIVWPIFPEWNLAEMGYIQAVD